MSFYGYKGSAALKGFGGAAPELFVGGPKFIGGLDQGVFYGTDVGFIEGAKRQGFLWIPADQSTRTKASAKWVELSSPDVSDKDLMFKESMQKKFDTLLESFFGALGTKSILGYSPDATQAIIGVGDQLKAALRQLVAYRVTLQPAEPPPPIDIPLPKETVRTVTARSAIEYTGDGAPPAAPPAEDKTKLYVLLGAGGLAVLGAVLLLRRRRPAVAGYRRRRSRR